jgi:hypothetical protein
MAVILSLLLSSMGCRYYEAGKQAAVSAVVTSILRLQSNAPLTQNSAARPATPDHGRRLIASRTGNATVTTVTKSKCKTS